MAQRAGSADLPLHGGQVPKWLADRMTRLGAVMSEAIVHQYGRDELLRRLAHPFWFQSFGAVMGMDWHSSGITTSVIGALKRGLAPLSNELGVHVCGGRGKHSRQTPRELVAIGERMGFDGSALANASRLVAKVDSAAVQDGFDLYLHGFIVTNDGRWVVVQQGMNGDRKQARRYHWLSEGLKSFVEEPHSAIDGVGQGEIINLTDRRARASRRGQLGVLHSLGPDGIARELLALASRVERATTPRVYDQTIHVLKSAVRNAKLGREEELAALKRLDDQARLLERPTSSSPVEALIAEERRLSHSYAGRSVFGWEHPLRDCIAVNSAGGHSGSGQILG